MAIRLAAIAFATVALALALGFPAGHMALAQAKACVNGATIEMTGEYFLLSEREPNVTVFDIRTASSRPCKLWSVTAPRAIVPKECKSISMGRITATGRVSTPKHSGGLFAGLDATTVRCH